MVFLKKIYFMEKASIFGIELNISWVSFLMETRKRAVGGEEELNILDKLKIIEDMELAHATT